jgi:hypothetical protein
LHGCSFELHELSCDSPTKHSNQVSDPYS